MKLIGLIMKVDKIKILFHRWHQQTLEVLVHRITNVNSLISDIYNLISFFFLYSKLSKKKAFVLHQLFLGRSKTTFQKRNPFFLTRIKIKTHKNDKSMTSHLNTHTLSLSHTHTLSLSLSHTHTHSHTLFLSFSLSYSL